jgi:hypothetical protein
MYVRGIKQKLHEPGKDVLLKFFKFPAPLTLLYQNAESLDNKKGNDNIWP